MIKKSKPTKHSGKVGVVFFGSGPVAAKSLELLAQDFKIEAVVTKPKPEHHKGSFPVLDITAKLNLTTYTVSNKVELSDLISKRLFKSSLGVLIDFGIIVTQDVIDYFPLGIVNSHFSLLPQWRGADPITFSVLSRQEVTGVSLMLLVEKMDEGPILAQAPYVLSPAVTTPELTEGLIEVSYAALKEIVPLYMVGKIVPMPQDPSIPTSYSRKLTKEDGIIDWQKSASQIEREIRAFIDWPKSRTMINGRDVIITKAHVLPLEGTPGTVTVVDKNIVVFCAKHALQIDKLKPAGKNEMNAEAFLAGYKIEP